MTSHKLPVSYWLIFVVTIFFLQGCDSRNSADIANTTLDRVELYYRDFDTLGFSRLSEKDLVKSADIKEVVTDKKSIAMLLKLIDLACVPDESSTEDKMDLYFILYKYKKGTLVGTWKASRFNFYQTPEGELCKLDRVDRDQLEQAIERFPPEELMVPGSPIAGPGSLPHGK